MRLRAKLLTLAAIPLVLTLALIATTVWLQQRELAKRERALVEDATMKSRREELRNYVALGVSTIRPLYDSGRADGATKAEALRLLSSLDYGDDGYFFVYDLQGRVLVHARQPELVGRDLWELRDSEGRATIQRLIAEARGGGGWVDYQWRKPSTGQMTPKLGYVVALPRWNWMVGTGLYLDDVQATMTRLDAQVSSNVTQTLLWIAGIAGGGLALLSVSGLWLNLSELRVTDAKLRLLTRQVVRSQEDERAHLARELHDGTSQTLVSAKLLVESAVEQIGRQPGGERAPPALARALSRLNEALVEVRRISHRLRPAMLDTLGLPAALELLGRESGESRGMSVRVDVEGAAVDLPGEVNTVLFRVAQEALANIAKHAAAREVRLALRFAPGGGVALVIADDGRGFDLEAVRLDPRRGIGLRNMRERLDAVGGRFDCRSAPGAGTTLVAEVPVDAIDRLRPAG